MPIAKTHPHAGQHDEARFGNVPPAAQSFLGLAGRFSARYGRLVAVHAQRWVSMTCKIIIFPS